MEKNHNNQSTNKPQGTNHNKENKTDGQTNKPETAEPAQKPNTPHKK